ncbi:sulfotransferase family protein [Thioalkalivibrio thiocyanodenitrificans]|uniref:sulfotransferase family protein n=1 Tax=Thioalkalivibrio thiocyanodenitrificans TaxID=243063 RepID=UPI0003674415|nr:sulfotransferase family protein [Thioalkalivibrio thiocyanodenitrificans]
MTQLIHRAGFHVGRDVLGPHACNLNGLWENEAVVAFNERLLSARGSMWCDPAPVSLEGALNPGSPERTALADLLSEQYPADRDVVLKDPRVCRLAPLYTGALEDLGYRVRIVVALRHPGESAESLYRRDGMPRGVGHALWVGHMLAALDATAGLDATVISYDELLHGGEVPVRNLASWLLDDRTPSADLIDALMACIDPSLYHSRSERQHGEGAGGAIQQLALHIHEGLVRRGGALPEPAELRVWRERYGRLVAEHGWSHRPRQLVLHDAPDLSGSTLSDVLDCVQGSSSTGVVLVRDGAEDGSVDRRIEDAATAGHLALFYNLCDRGEAASLVRGLSLCGGRGALLLRRSAWRRVSFWIDWLERDGADAGPVVSWYPKDRPPGRAEPEALYVPGSVAGRTDPWPQVAEGADALNALIRAVEGAGARVIQIDTGPGDE